MTFRGIVPFMPCHVIITILYFILHHFLVDYTAHTILPSFTSLHLLLKLTTSLRSSLISLHVCAVCDVFLMICLPSLSYRAVWKKVSSAGKDLVSKLLTIDPIKR